MKGMTVGQPNPSVGWVGRPRGTVGHADSALLDAYAVAIDRSLDALYAWTSTTGWAWLPNCPLEQERSLMRRQYGPGGDWDGSDADTNLWLCSLYLLSAAQHLEGIRALLEARQVVVPVAPLVRSVFEVAGRVAWMLEPLPHRIRRLASWNVRVRAARLAVVRVEDLTRAKTVSLSMKSSLAPARGKDLHTLTKKLIPAQFYKSEIVRDNRGRLLIAGQGVPGLAEAGNVYTRLHGEDWSAGGVYDWLSNATHPTATALLELMSDQNAAGQRRFEIESADYPARLSRLALVTFLRTWSQIAQYLGQTLEEIDALLQIVGDIDHIG